MIYVRVLMHLTMQRLNLQMKDQYEHITGHETLDAAASEAEAWFERWRTDQRFNPSAKFGPEGTNHITDLSGANGDETNGCWKNNDTNTAVDGTIRHDHRKSCILSASLPRGTAYVRKHSSWTRRIAGGRSFA